MKALVVLILFIGMFFVIQGIYEEKLKSVTDKKQIEYKFIPRTYYEEQLGDNDLTSKMAPMFNRESPWFDRNVGMALVQDKSKMAP
jgi:hypothetical protein